MQLLLVTAGTAEAAVEGRNEMSVKRFVLVALLAAVVVTPAWAARTPLSEEQRFAPQAAIDFAPHPELFGTQETFNSSAATFPQWTDMERRAAKEFAADDHACSSRADTHCTPAEWSQLVAELRPLPLREKIERANEAMNRLPYIPTAVNWHRSMYWEAPFQFLRHGGQCQDYAIAKYFLLRQAGVPAEAMRMVVLRDTAIAEDHAVLAVYVDGQAMVLDNLRADIVSTDRATAYRPYYSINETGWWRHTGARAQGFAMASR